jgi:hypothetical protein
MNDPPTALVGLELNTYASPTFSADARLGAALVAKDDKLTFVDSSRKPT